MINFQLASQKYLEGKIDEKTYLKYPFYKTLLLVVLFVFTFTAICLWMIQTALPQGVDNRHEVAKFFVGIIKIISGKHRRYADFEVQLENDSLTLFLQNFPLEIIFIVVAVLIIQPMIYFYHSATKAFVKNIILLKAHFPKEKNLLFDKANFIKKVIGFIKLLLYVIWFPLFIYLIYKEGKEFNDQYSERKVNALEYLFSFQRFSFKIAFFTAFLCFLIINIFTLTVVFTHGTLGDQPANKFLFHMEFFNLLICSGIGVFIYSFFMYSKLRQNFTPIQN